MEWEKRRKKTYTCRLNGRVRMFIQQIQGWSHHWKPVWGAIIETANPHQFAMWLATQRNKRHPTMLWKMWVYHDYLELRFPTNSSSNIQTRTRFSPMCAPFFQNVYSDFLHECIFLRKIQVRFSLSVSYNSTLCFRRSFPRNCDTNFSSWQRHIQIYQNRKRNRNRNSMFREIGFSYPTCTCFTRAYQKIMGFMRRTTDIVALTSKVVIINQNYRTHFELKTFHIDVEIENRSASTMYLWLETMHSIREHIHHIGNGFSEAEKTNGL